MKQFVLILLGLFINDVAYSQYTLTGTVKTDNDTPIPGVLMDDTPILYTDVFGNYMIDNLETGFHFLHPAKNTEPLNGVTVCDIVKVQRHILGIELLDSPYKIIAADLNDSYGITAFDMILMQQAILGINTSFFPETWQFYNSDLSFLNVNNPTSWDDLENEDFGIDIFEDSVKDIIGVKKGDVNNSVLAVPNFVLPNTDNLFFKMDEGVVEPQNDFVVNFNADGFNEVFGFQFTLEYDNSKMEFVGMDSDILINGFQSNFFQIAQDAVTVAWINNSDQPFTFEDGVPVFRATFNILEETDLSQSLEMNSDYTPIASMDANGCYGEAENVIPTDIIDNRLLTNITISPNPMLDEFLIDIQLDKVSDVHLELHNLIGQSIFNKKLNEKMILETVNLNAYPAGIYLLNIEVAGKTTTQRIIKL